MQVNISFSDVDIFILANRMPLKQLRHELNSARLMQALAEFFDGTEYQSDVDLFPWGDYVNLCEEAIRWIQGPANKAKPALPYNHINPETVKAKVDIVEIIEGYTKLRKAGKNLSGCCPIHNDKHPSLMVYPDQQRWRCYGCNRGGDVIEFIKQIENVDFRKALTILS